MDRENAMRTHSWLKLALKRAQRTQRELAAYLGLDPAAVNRLIGGQRELKARELQKIREFFNDDDLIPAEILQDLDVLSKALFEDNASLSKESLNIAEVNVSASAGHGAVVDYEQEERSWRFPERWVRSELNTTPTELRIITIEGDSMVSEPSTARDLLPGDKAVVNVGDIRPSPPGVFVVHDGLGLVAKRIEYVADSDPPTIRILSNNPAYPEYQRTLEEARIMGRVVGRWQRL